MKMKITHSSYSPPQVSAPLLLFAARGLVVSEILLWPAGTVAAVFPAVTCLTCFQLLSVSAEVFLAVLGVLPGWPQVFPVDVREIATKLHQK